MNIRALLRCILLPLVLLPLFASASFAFSLQPGPVFEPATELALHEAIAPEGVIAPADLAKRLHEVDIRTTLADTSRWRGELG